MATPLRERRSARITGPYREVLDRIKEYDDADRQTDHVLVHRLGPDEYEALVDYTIPGTDPGPVGVQQHLPL